VGPDLISGGLPADDDNLMFPHPAAPTPRRRVGGLAGRISRKIRVIGLRFVHHAQSESLVTAYAEPLSRSSTTLSPGERDPLEVDSLGGPLAGRTTRSQVSFPRREGGLFAGGGALHSPPLPRPRLQLRLRRPTLISSFSPCIIQQVMFLPKSLGDVSRR
jgi:hypothetical protein